MTAAAVTQILFKLQNCSIDTIAKQLYVIYPFITYSKQNIFLPPSKTSDKISADKENDLSTT